MTLSPAVYSPLKQYGAGTTAKKVGVIGIGGLGHFALLFAKALGAEVTAISHTESKKEDAMKMGASHFLATHGDEKAFDAHKRTLDLIIATTNDSAMPLVSYLSVLSFPLSPPLTLSSPRYLSSPYSPFFLLTTTPCLVVLEAWRKLDP